MDYKLCLVLTMIIFPLYQHLYYCEYLDFNKVALLTGTYNQTAISHVASMTILEEHIMDEITTCSVYCCERILCLMFEYKPGLCRMFMHHRTNGPMLDSPAAYDPTAKHFIHEYNSKSKALVFN